jgi:hypothetical protein
MPLRTTVPPLVGFVLGFSISAQAQATAPWPTTQLDSVASVHMPYAGTVDDELSASGITVFATNTSDNEYDAIVFLPPADPAHPLKPGQVWLPDVNQFLTQLMRLHDKSFTKAKLKTSFPVTVPSAPGGRAMHQIYSGFDEFHQIPAALELTWVLAGAKLYVFRCAYSMPQEKGAAEDAQHFFRTIEFKQRQP